MNRLRLPGWTIAAASVALGFGVQPAAWQGQAGTPIALHPGNPHYFLWRGRPTILITSGRALRRGAEPGLRLSQVPRHAGRRRHELHARLQRRLRRARRARSTSRATRWPRRPAASSPVGAQRRAGLRERRQQVRSRALGRRVLRPAEGLRRLRRRKNVVVELTLFCPMYEEMQWKLSPMNAANNVNGVGTVGAHRRLHARQARRPAGRAGGAHAQDRHGAERVRQPLLRDLQRAVLRRRDDRLAASHRRRDRRDRARPAARSISIAQNIANKSAKIEKPHPAVSIFNFHYATPPDTVGMNYALNKVIGDDETGFRGTDRRALPDRSLGLHPRGRRAVQQPRLLVRRRPRGRHLRLSGDAARRRQPRVSPPDEDSERLHPRLRLRPHEAGQLGDQGRRAAGGDRAGAGRARQGDGDLRAEGRCDRAVVGALDRLHRGAVERRVRVPHVFQRRHSAAGERRRRSSRTGPITARRKTPAASR